MEAVKKQSWFRKFLNWLKTPDIDENEGEINETTFKDENPKILATLVGNINEVNKKADKMFGDNAKSSKSKNPKILASLEGNINDEIKDKVNHVSVKTSNTKKKSKESEMEIEEIE